MTPTGADIKDVSVRVAVAVLAVFLLVHAVDLLRTSFAPGGRPDLQRPLAAAELVGAGLAAARAALRAPLAVQRVSTAARWGCLAALLLPFVTTLVALLTVRLFDDSFMISSWGLWIGAPFAFIVGAVAGFRFPRRQPPSDPNGKGYGD